MRMRDALALWSDHLTFGGSIAFFLWASHAVGSKPVPARRWDDDAKAGFMTLRVDQHLR